MAYVMQHRLAKQYRKMDSHLSNFKNSDDGENERNNVLCLLLDEVMEPELDELEVRERDERVRNKNYYEIIVYIYFTHFFSYETKDVLDEIPKVDVSRILRDDLQLPVLSHEAATWQKKKLPEATSRSVKMLNDVHANIMKGLENQYGKPIQVSTKRTVLRTVGCSI